MCGGAKWKREEVPDHKFDFIDTHEFYDNSFIMRLKYLWLYFVILKSFLVYISDIFSAITMLSTSNWSSEIFRKCQTTPGCFFIPFKTGKWLFVGCIIFSFLLLAYESRKSKKIIASKDISFAFTNVMANNYYSLRSYDHFCFFEHISDSTKLIDDFAFFVFFTFKSWKQLILADGPRQTINGLTLYAVWLIRKKNPGNWYNFSKYFVGNSMSTTALTITALFTVIVFLGSLLLLVIAGICYIPLLCHIRGNLKEYCCHKVDKRIDDVIKKRQKARLAENAKLAQKEAMGDFSHLKNKKGEIVGKRLPQPTLPNICLDDDEDDTSTLATKVASSTHTKDFYYADKSPYGDYPPPMPAYNPYSTHQPPGAFPHFNPSAASLPYDNPPSPYQTPQSYDDSDTARLTTTPAPISSTGNPPYSAGYDSYGGYPGRAASTQPVGRRYSPPSSVEGGLAYDDASIYSEHQQHNDTYGGYQNSSTQPPNGRRLDDTGGYGQGGSYPHRM